MLGWSLGGRLVCADSVEPVSDSEGGGDPEGYLREGLELLAEPPDMHVHGLGIAVEAVAPHRSDDRLTREHPSGVAQEQRKQIELFRGEAQLHGIDVNRAGGTVDPEALELLELRRADRPR